MSALIQGLRSTLMLGAMMADATPQQRRQLRGWHNLYHADFRAGRMSWQDWDAGFRAVMGPDWQPTGQWATQLEALDAEPTG